VVVCICHPNYEGGIKRLAWAKTGDSISKITRAIWRNGERLPGKHEALSSNSSSAKKKKNSLAGHWWLVPVIPAIQEAAIGRIMVQS
jgi:hypothetical protein